jgi:hypothetical protein
MRKHNLYGVNHYVSSTSEEYTVYIAAVGQTMTQGYANNAVPLILAGMCKLFHYCDSAFESRTA